MWTRAIVNNIGRLPFVCRTILFCGVVLPTACAMRETRGTVERMGMCRDNDVIYPVVHEWYNWKKSVHYMNGSNKVTVVTRGRECDVLVDGEWWVMSERQAKKLQPGQSVVIRH